MMRPIISLLCYLQRMPSVQIVQHVLLCHTSAFYREKTGLRKDIRGFSSFPHTLVFQSGHNGTFYQPFLLLNKYYLRKQKSNQTKEAASMFKNPGLLQSIS